MFEILRHLDGVCRAGKNTEVAKCTHLEVVYEFVNHLSWFSVYLLTLVDDLDGSVGTGDYRTTVVEL